MTDVNKKADRKRLFTAIKRSDDRIDGHRKARKLAIKQYVGRHFNVDEGQAQNVPVNMLELGVQVYLTNLLVRAPAALVTTRRPDIKATAYDLELALNYYTRELDLDRTLRRFVVDAMFGMGIIKIGVTPRTGRSLAFGMLHDDNEPFVDLVSLDNWFHDATAESWENIQFCGNRYRLPLDIVKSSGLYNRKAVEALSTVGSRSNGGERASTVSGLEPDADTDYAMMVELMDVWLPLERRVVTLASGKDGSEGEPLRIVDWEGPDYGPYHFLRFTEVPDQLMPLPPIATWMDLHLAINQIYVKLLNQIKSQKTVYGVLSTNAVDGKAVQEADDGDVVRLGTTDPVEKIDVGGLNQTSMAAAIHLKQVLEYAGGNWASLGGLSPQAETLGQDRLLIEQASGRLRQMQERVIDAVSGIYRHIAFLAMNNLGPVMIWKTIPSANLAIPGMFDPLSDQSGLLDYDITIDAYSMRPGTPGARAQAIMGIIGQVVVPMMELFKSQGITIDAQGLVQKLARYAGIEDIDDILKINPNQGEPQPDQKQRGNGPANTSHTTTRVNRSAGTQRGADDVMMRAMLGQQSQPAETDAAMMQGATG